MERKTLLIESVRIAGIGQGRDVTGGKTLDRKQRNIQPVVVLKVGETIGRAEGGYSYDTH